MATELPRSDQEGTTMRMRHAHAISVAIATALLMAFASAPASASPPGSETVDRSGTLETSGQSMWQAGAGGGPQEKTLTLFDKRWEASGSGGQIVDAKSPPIKVCNIFKGKTVEKFFTEGSTSCEEEEELSVNFGDFGAEGSASTKGEIGMSVKLHGFASGSIGVTYPVTAHYTIPKPYSFAAGDPVTVGTSETVDPGAVLSTSFPTLESAELDGVFGFHADGSFNLCFFECTGNESIFDFSLPEGYDGSNPASGKILEVANPGTLCFNAIVGFVAGFGNAPEQYTRCHNGETGTNTGYIALPNVQTTSALHGDGTLTAEGEDPYAVVPISAVTWATRMLPGKPPVPLNFGPAKIPGTSITLGWKTIQLIFTDIEAMRQAFSFKPRVDTTLSWAGNLHYAIAGPHGEAAGEGTGGAVTFPLGDKLTLTTPSDLEGTLTVAPKLSMGSAELSNDTENLSIGEGEASALALTLDTPEAEAEAFGHKFTAWPGTEIKLGPLFKQPFPLATTRSGVVDSSWTLGGFNEPALQGLPLVPDPPPIAAPVTVKPVEGLSFEGEIARFTDPEPSSGASDYSVRIAWGDGAEEAGTLTDIGSEPTGTVFDVKARHVFTEEGEYPVDVTITDVDTPSLSVTDHSQALVSDAPLYASAHSDTTTLEGAPALLWPEPPSSGALATFTDEDPYGEIADYTATIDWGDGHTSAGAITETASGSHVWRVSGEHLYGPEDLGPHGVTVRIRDTGGSETTVTLTAIAYAYTAGGDFAIAPAPVGSPATFWSARWSTLNPLAQAPNSFKGWSDSAPTPPGCASSWTTRPGDSSEPPLAVPSYVAVLETGPVSQHGSQIAGQAHGVAIVHTEDGYGPAPGHAGTGTVVAQVCPAG
jgi:hypothetical protein